MYDFLIVGSGLYGAVLAYEAKNRGKNVLVIEKRNHIGGNIYCENVNGINVHKYGAHIFHTNNKNVWDYIGQFSQFNRYTNSPIANYNGEVYNLPFNMNTFHQMWGVITPQEAMDIIEKQKADYKTENPSNLEQQAINLVGVDIYEKLVKGYTEKQWGRKCDELPPFIIKRLPVRFTYDNNYFNDMYQGIPIGGYTKIIEKLLEGIEVRLETDFLSDRENYEAMAEKVIYTGAIDAYYDYCYGKLEYRTVYFKTQELPVENYQGNAVVNYTDSETPYTRIIEHKHFEYGIEPTTVISKEYPKEWQEGDEPYYPVNNEKNQELYSKYAALAAKNDKVLFGGRLGEYKYYDMDKVIESALNTVSVIFK